MKNLEIYKLSHGDGVMSSEQRSMLLERRVAWVNAGTSSDQLQPFQTAPVGTLFFLCHSNRMQLFAQLTTPATLSVDGEWYEREYRVLTKALKHSRYEGPKKKWTPNYNSTFALVQNTDLANFEGLILQPYFGIELVELAARASIDLQATASPPHTLIERPTMNRIYYGPPGTGKTYTLQRLLDREYAQPVQTVALEQRRRQFIVEKIEVLTRWRLAAAVLYDLGGKATVPQIFEHQFIKSINADKPGAIKTESLWAALQTHTVGDSATVKYGTRSGVPVFDKTVDSGWHFAGEWDNIKDDIVALVLEYRKLNAPAVDDTLVQRYKFVTFHQSFGYEEFVEGLRPVLDDENEETSEIRYEIRPGVFKQLCRDARLSPNERFAMVIDEINRGNISKIFGELITLIEADKRDPMNGEQVPIEVTLPYSGEKFSVPANVDIIGTMNTADRSLALLDTALRRRFDFVALMPDTRAEKDSADPDSAPLAGLQVTLNDVVIDVRRLLERINERIEALYDRDHCIGHAYLTALAKVSDGEKRFWALTQIFRNRILPLLEEYFFEDWQKIRLVLGDNQKLEALQFVSEHGEQEQDLAQLFGSDHGLDTYATQRRYRLQEATFGLPAAYVAIYQVTAA